MKRVLLISFAISGVLGALFFLVVLPNLRPSDAPLGSWPDYEQASSLIQHSDQIIIPNHHRSVSRRDGPRDSGDFSR